MRFINDGNFTIAPFEFDSIEELKIERSINEHATLYVKGVAKAGWKDMPVTDATEYTNVKCADSDNVYFSGVLQEVITTYIDDVYYLEAHAVSHTIKLDTKRYKRSFQDTGGTYGDIVKAIISDEGGTVNYHANDKTVERILVQNNETNWQFVKRLASHTYDVLTPISKMDNPEFNFGVEDESCMGEIEEPSFSIFKDFELLRSRSNDEQPLDEGSISMYKVKTYDFAYGMYDVGEKVKFNKKDLIVRHALLSIEDSVVTCYYTLSIKNAITAPKYYNSSITGLVLRGTVQAVENDDVKLDLDIDYKSGTIQFFKYATDYSSESHTGWYVMPEVGDTVFLVLPSDDEREAHAESSMRRSGTSRTSDPLTKYLRTTFGKEIKLDNSEVLITAKDGETYVKINEGSGIEIYTLMPINIFSDSTLDIASTGDMSISTDAKLSISSKGDMSISTDSNMNVNSKIDMSVETKANLSVEAIASIETTCGANIVTINPGSGIKATTDTELNLLSSSDTNIESKSKMALTSADDMLISTTNNLIETGKTSVVLNNTPNVIAMEPFTGVNAAGLAGINLASPIGPATLTGNAGVFVTTGLGSIAVTAPIGNVGVSGNAAVNIVSGASSIKMTPANVAISSALITEN